MEQGLTWPCALLEVGLTVAGGCTPWPFLGLDGTGTGRTWPCALLGVGGTVAGDCTPWPG
jgi:hypothetical protein